MASVRLLLVLGVLAFVGCKDDCPPCQEPRTYPINFGGKCVKSRSDPRCEGYVPKKEADLVLRPQVLCMGTGSEKHLMGVWDSRPQSFDQGVGEIRRIQSSQATLGAFGPGIPLCPDVIPGRDEDRFTALTEARDIRVQGWGYSAEISRYWVVGTATKDN